MKKFFTKKRIIIGSVLLLVIIVTVVFAYRKSGSSNGVITETAKYQDLNATVLATGQVTSSTDLALSFKLSGVVANVAVKVGDTVKSGQLLAGLEQRDQSASLTQARGSLAQAEANYQKVLAGASSEEVKVAESAVDSAQVTLANAKLALENTKKTQEVLVKNAYTTMLNSSPSAVANSKNISTPTVTISGTYTGIEQGTYTVTAYSGGGGTRFYVSGLEVADSDIKANIPVPLGRNGLFIQFSTTALFQDDSWTVAIPNTRANSYITNFTAYQSALQNQKTAIDSAQAAIDSAQIAVLQAMAALDLKKAHARPAEIASARAQILSAQGQVQAAMAAYSNGQIISPANATVTSLDIKPGELATAQKAVIVLQDIGSLHVEANISEANIINIKLGQKVDITFDAFGQDRRFIATVTQINPASTVVSGVVNYKVTASLEKMENIKPGMTANMTISTFSKNNALAIPARAILTRDSKKFVRVITNEKTKKYKETEVTTGLEADGGLVEILSGLNEGQEVITFINKK